MKMYILVKDTIPQKFVPVITAHASLACYLQYQNDDDMQKWIKGVFKKVVCSVNEKEFENAKREIKNVVLTESALDNQEVCLAFCPRENYPKTFQYFTMWK